MPAFKNITGATSLFVTATDTGVGKTVVAGAIAYALRGMGVDVGVMKPAESGCKAAAGRLVPADATFLKRVSGSDDPVELICPYRFAEPLAPAVAAKRAGIEIEIGLIRERFQYIASRHGSTIVEGAGGLMTPLSGGYLYLDLAADLGLPVVIVAPAGLGAINHTLLTYNAVRSRGLEVHAIILNRRRPGAQGLAELTNPDVIRELTGLDRVFTLPYAAGVKRSLRAVGALADALSGQGFFSL